MNNIYLLCITLLCLSPHISKSDAIELPIGFGVNFYESMECIKDKIGSLQKIDAWKKLKNSYDQHVIKNITYKNQRIPKIIHQIWLGTPLPEKYKKLQKTWIDNHPDWEYKLWTDKDIEEFGLIYKKEYDACPGYGAKSDIARYEILYRIGGLYVDTDFECLRPFDIFNHCFDFYTGAAYFTNCTAWMALIAAVPEHPILKYCLESLDLEKISNPLESMDVLTSTGPKHFSDALNRHLEHNTDACVAFPAGYFYPWPHFSCKENSPEHIKKWIRAETFAIHHWHSSWSKPVKSSPLDTESYP